MFQVLQEVKLQAVAILVIPSVVMTMLAVIFVCFCLKHQPSQNINLQEVRPRPSEEPEELVPPWEEGTT